MNRLRVASAIAAVCVLCVVSVALAHVTLVSSVPAAGSVLDAEPAQLRLTFSEAVDASLAKVSVTSGSGVVTPLLAANDPANAYAIVASVPALGRGTFRITWRVVSDDGHPVAGSFSYSIGTESRPPPVIATDPQSQEPDAQALTAPPLLPAVLRGLAFGSLAALTGLLAFSLKGGITAAHQRLTVILAVAAPVLLAAHFFAWLAHTAPDGALTREWISAAVSSSAGRFELWRALLAIGPVWALLLARRRPLAFALTIPPLLLGATIGHAAAFTPMWSVPMKSLHLAALAAWMGGLLWLSMCDRTEHASILREATRVSNVALISVVTIALSGIGQAYVLLHTLDNIGSTYGAVVIVKVLGLGMLIAFGAFHRFRILPRLAEQAASAAGSFAKSLRAEIAVMWLVILIGGALAYIQPPKPDMNPRGESQR